jgi:hypothetical protein
MTRQVLEWRGELSLIGSLFAGVALLWQFPFPAEAPLFREILLTKPVVFYGIASVYHLLLFSSPYSLLSAVLSLAYIVKPPAKNRVREIKLPPFPRFARESLFLVVGEVHRGRQSGPCEDPNWLVIPERGLFTGVAIFGAIGSGKTTCCMGPFADQILSYDGPEGRIGGLVLEVKGGFCHEVREILEKQGRGDDYIEINLTDSLYRYNPLWNDLEPYALAYGIATLLNSLFGKGREPFWQQAYTNMVKFIILLHRLLYGYCTLFDIYECAINPELLERRIKVGEAAMLAHRVAAVEMAAYIEHEGLARFTWEKNASTDQMEALLTPELEKFLAEKKVSHEVKELDALPSGVKPIRDEYRREQFQAVRRWFYEDWMRIEQRLRTSIVEGISFFLSLFDDNPTLKKIFCPPKECYDPGSVGYAADGKPLPPFAELIEQGKVVALNFPASGNPGLARMIGTLMKVDFQRAVLGRVQKMEDEPERTFRPVLFLCDEYHAFATVGESDPTGDEKFFSLSRQSRCIPIVATQSISSLRSTTSGEAWRTLLQTFRTKIFLSLSDDFTARVASDLCGRAEQLKLSYNLSENGQDARVSILTGRSTAHKATVSTSKSYSVQMDNIFEARVFSELKNGEAIVLAYDGLNPLPPTYCYLKPNFLDRDVSYFEHLEKEQL